MTTETKPLLPKPVLTTPGILYYIASAITLFITTTISKIFLACTAKVESPGLDNFLALLKEREDVSKRSRGLLTVANHTSVVDDPLLWGLLPYRYLMPDTTRWALGSHDICFQGHWLSKYFMLGQVLPTHRLKYSAHGGLFQPTLTQCIRMLSNGPFTSPTPLHPAWESGYKEAGVTHTYTTTGCDRFQAPSSYGCRRHSWLHVFPEGRIHQHDDASTEGPVDMQYLRWGVARMILESEPCPQVVPMWLEGIDRIMHESRKEPRMLPRPFGKKVTVMFGDPVDDAVWQGYRARWKNIVAQEAGKEWEDRPAVGDDGFWNDELRYGFEAQKLRIEVALEVRKQILTLRKARGWPDEKEACGLPEISRRNGCRRAAKIDVETWSDNVWT